MAICITNTEDWEAYKFVLDAVLDSCGAHRFDTLMADSAKAITKAFKKELKGRRRIGSRKLCWFHVAKNMKDFVKNHSIGNGAKALISPTAEAKTVEDARELMKTAERDFGAKSSDLAVYFRENWIDNPYSWLAADCNGAPTPITLWRVSIVFLNMRRRKE